MFRKVTLALIVAVGLCCISLLSFDHFRYFRQEVKSCFDDVQGLRTGAEVRIAGVDVGRVTAVRVDPQAKGCPAEVVMEVATTYELKIPKDSVAGISTAGILGPSYVAIDTSQASGESIENYGYLKGKRSVPPPSLEDDLKALDLIVGLAAASQQKRGEPPKEGVPPSRHPSHR